MEEKRESPQILDNHSEGADLAAYLRAGLEGAEVFRLVSAYFSVFGFNALADKLEAETLKKTRFLFGAPESAGNINLGEKNARRFDLTEEGLTVEEDVLRQRELAERCAKWIESEKVQVRAASKNNLIHGKMYHMESAAGGAATVGSSNFTHRGLGLSKKANLEINLAVQDAKTRAELAKWFDNLWNSKNLVYDAKQEVLNALKRWHDEYAPEFIYYKTLFELFRKELEGDKSGERQREYSRLIDSDVWHKLYEFQKDGAKSAINRLLRHNGCILADSVGLGKTYTALAAIKYFELRGENVLVLCPKKLENNWRIYQKSAGAKNNPFAGDHFRFYLLSHTDLTRESGMSGNINLANFDWGQFGLVVIDESHNFRNDSKDRKNEKGEITRVSRYQKLLEEVIKKDAQTKVLMLSATPVNTSLFDLQNQIYLITGKHDDSFADSLGVRNIGQIVKAAQKKFQDWENTPGEKNKGKLLEMLGGDFFHLLGGITIARSRRQIQQFYADFIKEQGDFPRREKPQNESPHTDSAGEFSYEKLYADIERLEFHIYRPSDYVESAAVIKRLKEEKDKFHFNQKSREGLLVAMMRVNFMKRLESSAHACTLTLKRTLEKINAQIEKIDRYLAKPDKEAQTDTIPENDAHEEDEDFIVNRKAMNPYYLHDLDVKKWRADMKKDRKALQNALNKVQKINPERDGKLALLKELLQKKAAQKNRKLLIFTAFKDTAAYLYGELQQYAKEELKINAAMVAGDETKTEYGENNFLALLDNFAPQARERGANGEEIDLLIATDCISEGQNLQDCDTVLNYDIHWNPVRLIQRFGRIDRIGSKNTSVKMINFWPTDDMDFYLNLQNRVRARMALANISATDEGGLDETDISEETAQMDLEFRNKQIMQIRKEVLDLDELDDSISMTDLTLDHFLTQLLRYLEKNREELNNAPPGIYAVADCAASGLQNVQPGAIFFFRQKNHPDENSGKNPTRPFYFVQVEKDRVRRGYMRAKEILQLFESMAGDKTTYDTILCDAFSREIKTPEGLARYGKMAKAAVKDIQTTFDKNAAGGLGAGGGRGVLLAKESENPLLENLELLTWLVIRSKKEKPPKKQKDILTPPHEKNPPPRLIPNPKL